MSARQRALQQRLAKRLRTWQDPHGGAPFVERVEHIDLGEGGQCRLTVRPSRPHCPCCLYDLEALREALLAIRGVHAVELRVIGVPEPALWERALNPSA
ncbi:MAG: hypothetical protein ACPHK3_01930 [Candidatus Poseidoniaceae archaeon]